MYSLKFFEAASNTDYGDQCSRSTSVCQSISLCLAVSLCKHAETDRDSVWGNDWRGTNERKSWFRRRFRCGLRQITLPTCCTVHWWRCKSPTAAVVCLARWLRRALMYDSQCLATCVCVVSAGSCGVFCPDIRHQPASNVSYLKKYKFSILAVFDNFDV